MSARFERIIRAAACGLGILASSAATALAQSAVRELPEYYVPGTSLTVSIAITVPGGPIVVGLENQPPSDWAVLSISHGGVFDAQTRKVKWGPFFTGSVPSAVTYEIRPSGSGPEEQCFAGTASFNGLDQPVGGDSCIPHSVPTLSGLALCTLTVSLLGAGIVVLHRKSRLSR